ncbi:hypothetical protein JTB14_015036 [Gonioctena quinquepunctata]|nr:hypothetical protein JTB14_015036 [Gonioctena quinquepunctata]
MALDQKLRAVIREILHLPQATTNGILYCGKKDGGLGIPRLEWLLTSATLKADLNFVNNPDPVMQALTVGTKMKSRLKILAEAARINWPVDPAYPQKLQHKNEEKRACNMEQPRFSREIRRGLHEFPNIKHVACRAQTP